jgi:hypothetical protein
MFGQLFKYQHSIQKKNFQNNKTIGHKKFSKRKIESSSEDDIIEEQYTYNDTESSTCSDVYDNKVSNTKQKKQKNVKENNEDSDSNSDEDYTKSIENKKKIKFNYEKKYKELITNIKNIIQTADYEEYSDTDSISSPEEKEILKINTLKRSHKNFQLICRCINKSVLKNSNGDYAFRFFLDLKDESVSIRLLGFKKRRR